jgi:serine/threonine protein phosphatase PrpC
VKSILPYSDSADQELYKQTTLHHNKATIKLHAGTIAGSPKNPNEDAFAVTFEDEILLAGIFDGTTGFPVPALGKVTSARYASHFIKEQFGTTVKSMSPEKILLAINDRLWETARKLNGITRSDTLTLPASTATVIKIDVKNHLLFFAHIGDAFGIVYFDDGHSELFTDNKNNQFDEEIFALIRTIAEEDALTNREARHDKRINEALRHMYYKRNNNKEGKGSGLINGDPHVQIYIQTGEIDLQGVNAILLGTDGLLPQGWSEHTEQDRQQLFDQIQTGGFQKLFKTKKQSEDADPDWNHIRYKHSDDATGILVQMA